MSTLEPLFLIGSFSFLQVTRTTIKAWMSSNFGGIPSLTSELAALDQFKKSFIREYSKYLMTCCQVSDRCPLGYLFNLTGESVILFYASASSADSRRARCQLLAKEWALNTGKLPLGGLPWNSVVK